MLLEILNSIIAHKKRIMEVSSRLHTQKNLVTLGELVDMVKDNNWKKGVSYILFEALDVKNNKWKERGAVESVSNIENIDFNSKEGVLLIVTPGMHLQFSGVTESTLIREIVTSNDPNFRITAYTT